MNNYHPTWKGKDFNSSDEYADFLGELAKKKDNQSFSTDGQSIQVVGKMTRIWQSFLGFIGFGNQTNPKIVSLNLELLLQYGATQDFLSAPRVQEIVQTLQTKLQKEKHDAYKRVVTLIEDIKNKQYAPEESTASTVTSIHNFKQAYPDAEKKGFWTRVFQGKTIEIPKNIAKQSYHEALILIRLGKLSEAKSYVDAAIRLNSSDEWQAECVKLYLVIAYANAESADENALTAISCIDQIKNPSIQQALQDIKNQFLLILCADSIKKNSIPLAFTYLKQINSDGLLADFKKFTNGHPNLSPSKTQQGNFFLEFSKELPADQALPWLHTIIKLADESIHISHESYRALTTKACLELFNRYLELNDLNNACIHLLNTYEELKTCRQLKDHTTFNQLEPLFLEQVHKFMATEASAKSKTHVFIECSKIYISNPICYQTFIPQVLESIQKTETTTPNEALDLYQQLFALATPNWPLKALFILDFKIHQNGIALEQAAELSTKLKAFEVNKAEEAALILRLAKKAESATDSDVVKYNYYYKLLSYEKHIDPKEMASICYLLGLANLSGKAPKASIWSAANLLEKALELDPANQEIKDSWKEAEAQRGHGYMKTDQFQLALESFEKLREAFKDANLYQEETHRCAIEVAKHKAYQPELSLAAYKKALMTANDQQKVEIVNALLQQSLELVRKGLKKEGQNFLQIAREAANRMYTNALEYPNEWRCLIDSIYDDGFQGDATWDKELADLLLAHNRYSEAAIHYKNCLELVQLPEAFEGLHAAAGGLFKERLFDEAIAAYKALRKSCKNETAYEDELFECDFALAEQSNHDHAFCFDIGQVCEERMLLDQAANLYQKALKLDPDNQQYKQRLLGVKQKKADFYLYEGQRYENVGIYNPKKFQTSITNFVKFAKDLPAVQKALKPSKIMGWFSTNRYVELCSFETIGTEIKDLMNASTRIHTLMREVYKDSFPQDVIDSFELIKQHANSSQNYLTELSSLTRDLLNSVTLRDEANDKLKKLADDQFFNAIKEAEFVFEEVKEILNDEEENNSAIKQKIILLKDLLSPGGCINAALCYYESALSEHPSLEIVEKLIMAYIAADRAAIAVSIFDAYKKQFFPEENPAYMSEAYQQAAQNPSDLKALEGLIQVGKQWDKANPKEKDLEINSEALRLTVFHDQKIEIVRELLKIGDAFKMQNNPALAAKAYEKALPYLDQLSLQKAHQLQLFHVLARAAKEAKKYPLAKQYYEKSLDLDNQNPEFHVEIAEIHLEEGQEFEALHRYKEAQNLNPAEPAYSKKIIELRILLGDKHYHLALSTTNSIKKGELLNLAISYYRSITDGELPKIYQDYCNRLINAIALLGDTRTAIALYEQLEKVAPKEVKIDQRVYIVHSKTLFRDGTGLRKEAFECIDNAIKRFSHLPELQQHRSHLCRLLGDIYYNENNLSSAKTCYKGATKKYSVTPEVEAYIGLARISKQEGSFLETLENLQKAIQLQKKKVQAATDEQQRQEKQNLAELRFQLARYAYHDKGQYDAILSATKKELAIRKQLEENFAEFKENKIYAYALKSWLEDIEFDQPAAEEITAQFKKLCKIAGIEKDEQYWTHTNTYQF